MKKQNFKTLFSLILIIFISLVSIAIAQDESESNSNNFDKSNPETWDYSKSDVYDKVDPRDPRFDWTKADYKMIKFDDNRIYQTQGFYDNLPKEYYSKVNYKEADLSKLKQEDIDVNKFTADVSPDKSFSFGTKEKLECTDCKLTFVKNDDGSYTIKTDKGSAATITNYPAGTFFRLRKDGKIEIEYPKDTENVEIPKSDVVVVSMLPNYKIQGVDNNIQIEGKLLFIKGEVFIEPDQAVKINGINIRIFHPSGFPTRLYFDGEDHSNEVVGFVSLNPTKGVFISYIDAGSIDLSFSESNPFANFEKGDRLNIHSDKTRVEIRNRNKEDLIPFVKFTYLTYSDKPDSSVTIDNNDMVLNFKPDKYSQVLSTHLHDTSVPMEIHVFNRENQRIIGTNDKDMKLVISNFNEFAFLDLDKEEGFTDLSAENLPKGAVSTRLRYNSDTAFLGDIKGSVEYSSEKGLYVYKLPDGKEILFATETPDKIVIKRIIDQLEGLDDNLKREVRKVFVFDREQFVRECGVTAGACARYYDGAIIFNRETISRVDFFEHEAEHLKTIRIIHDYLEATKPARDEFKKEGIFEGKTAEEWDKRYNQLVNERTNKERELTEQFSDGKISDADFDAKISEIDSYYNPLLGEAFYNRYKILDARYEDLPEELKAKYRDYIENLPIFRWRKIAGNDYGNDLGPKDVGGNMVGEGLLSSRWADGTTGPRHGCLSPYACNNEHEDRSVWIEYVRSKPASFFEPLLDSTSPDYDPRYQQKLNELYIGGDISQENYNRIILNLPRERLMPVKRLTKEGRLVPVYEVIDKDDKGHKH